MEAAARAYFAAWNDKATRSAADGAAIGAFFSPRGVLRDWDVLVEGGAGPVGAPSRCSSASRSNGAASLYRSHCGGKHTRQRRHNRFIVEREGGEGEPGNQ